MSILENWDSTSSCTQPHYLVENRYQGDKSNLKDLCSSKVFLDSGNHHTLYRCYTEWDNILTLLEKWMKLLMTKKTKPGPL